MAIEVKGIRFAYGNSGDVLKDMSFSCGDNRVTGIIGPNGCGKTTVLKVMAGFLKPASGDIYYDNQPVGNFHPIEMAKLRAVVEQKIYTPFSFPVYDYVMLGRTPYHGNFESETDSDHQIVQDSLMSANALQFADKKVNALSGGELQRVMIAKALAQQPTYLMLDEPTSHLDIKHQLELMKLLCKLSHDISVVMVIHELNQAALYCDDVILTKGGHVISEGRTQDVLSAEALEDVFEVLALQIKDPENNRNQFTFYLPPDKNGVQKKKVHVISGEGKGRHILLSLKAAGFEPTAGVLNVGDQDFETAKMLGMPVITAQPFSPVGQSERVDLLHRLEAADVIVIKTVCVGKGNLANFETVAQFIGKKPMIMVNCEKDFKSLDYTGGRAEEIYNEISKWASVVKTSDEMLAELE